MSERLSNVSGTIKRIISTTGISPRQQLDSHKIRNGIVRFKIRAPHDAYIALSAKPSLDSRPIYEIILDRSGEQKQYKNCIQKDLDQSNALLVDSSGVLSAKEFRGFWIKWEDNIITVGKEGSTDPFMTWTEKEEVPVIAYVGVCTVSGATGTWKVEDGWEFKTPDKYTYSFVALNSGFVEFEFQGEKQLWVMLSRGIPDRMESSYIFVLGRDDNTKSGILCDNKQPYTVDKSTPNLLDPKKFKKFTIKWRCGKLQALAADGSIIVEWTSPHMDPVVAYRIWTESGLVHKIQNVRTGYGWFKSDPIIIKNVLSACPYMWVDAADGVVPENALLAGIGASNQKVYVARAKLENSWIVGSLEPPEKFVHFNWNKKKWTVSKYQVLVAGEEWSNREDLWFRISGDKTMKNALVAGLTDKREEMYVGRVNLNRGGIIVGGFLSPTGHCKYVDLDDLYEHNVFDILHK